MEKVTTFTFKLGVASIVLSALVVLGLVALSLSNLDPVRETWMQYAMYFLLFGLSCFSVSGLIYLWTGVDVL
jgi:hypothetical protein